MLGRLRHLRAQLLGGGSVRARSLYRTGAVNHFGILVDDLDATEQKILAAGYRTHSHQTYDPGSRFYFHDHDDIEWEVVSYA